MNLRCMSIRKNWKVLLPAGILALGFAAFMLSCSSDSTTAPTEPRTWFYEYEFNQDPGLVARPDQVVILDIVPGEGLSEHAIPYQHTEGGGYLFAIESDDPFITRAEVFDRFGVPAATTERGDGGVYLDMVPGSYSMKVYHDETGVPEEGSVAFIRQQIVGTAQSAAEDTTLREGEGSAMLVPESPGYGAMQIVGGDYDGQYLIKHNAGKCAYDSYEMFKAVPIDTKDGAFFKSRRHLFTFKSDSKGTCPEPPPSFVGSYHVYPFTSSEQPEYLVIYDVPCQWCPPSFCPDSQKKTPDRVWVPYFSSVSELSVSSCVQDMGDGSIHLWSYYAYILSSPLYVAENSYLFWTQYSYGKDPDNLKLVEGFRYYKDGSQIKREDLKKGEVTLYEGENYTGVAVVLSASFKETALIPLDQVKSVAFGYYTTTTVQFFSEPEFVGLIRTVGVDMPQNLNIEGGSIGSIKIFTDAKKVLISSKKCPYCNLAGVDLSDLNLDAADLSYADLMDASVHKSSLKKANMSNALLNGANLTNANLSGASLYNAFLNGNKDMDLGAAILTGAYLKNANLAGADLGGADFSNASFYSGVYNQAGCAQDPDNPPFTKNCASAQGANMNAAKFTGAYLAGADFSGTTATAADFTGSILSGATFKGSHLDWDSPTSARTDFSGTFIGGADFTNATAEGATFENAYVNFKSNGDCMLFTVSSTHTQFPGFYYQYGDSPCVMFAYSGPTVVVGTDSNSICPDGKSGPCDHTSWTSPSIPRNQSTQSNSSCFDTPPLCDVDHIDPNW